MMEESRSCYKCGYVTNEAVGQCPKCGRRLRTAKQVRRLGWVQLLIGVFLVGLMGTITFNLAPLMLRTGEPAASGARFTGTAEQAQLILGLFGLVILFGLTSMASGLWQIKTGRRNKWIFILMLALVVLLVLAGWLVRGSRSG